MGSPDVTAAEVDLPWQQARARPKRRVPHLVLAWSLDEADRLGESIAVASTVCVGRGEPLTDDPAERATLRQVRPGSALDRAPIASARISRQQLLLIPVSETEVRVRSLGRATVRLNGQAIDDAVARDGDLIEIHNAAVFVVVTRPLTLAPCPPLAFPFGRPDPFGIVGEGEVTWALRAELAFAAATDRHVLIMGDSGAGKELAARAIHGLSAHREQGFVARNAATMPETLIDAELFGNVKNYPNPGMPERPGLIGEADGSTLFLDEIGDLPEKSQVHLLRVLDEGGEYQRLGEARVRRSRFRLVAATNRPLEMLKHDFLARFTHRIAVPGLPERRDDVALVIAELLRRAARSNPTVANRFFERRMSQTAEARLAPDLLVRLLRHPFTHHVRELERILWLAISTAEGDYLGLTPAVEAELASSASSSADSADAPAELDRDALVQAMAAHGRSPTRAARALGLKNRFVLLRLLKKHGLSAGTDAETDA